MTQGNPYPSTQRSADGDSAPEFRRLVGRLRMRHLELLDLLGHDPNIGRAAKQMNLTQPTVSKLLIDIESIFGAMLFTRNRRGLEPTLAGTAICLRAGVLLEELQAARAELEVALRGATRRARIGVFPVAVPHLLVGIRERLLALEPRIVLSVEEGVEHQLTSALLAGRVDCILGRVVLEQLPKEILHEVLLHEPTVIVCGRKHPIVRARKSARLALLAESEWLLPAQDGAVYNMVASRLALNGLPAPRVTIETTSVHVTVELLNRSRLLGVLPGNVARSYERVDRLAILPIRLMESHYPLGIMFRRGAAHDPLVLMLIDAARAAAATGADDLGAGPGSHRS